MGDASDSDRKYLLMRWARAAAQSGSYADWQGVRRLLLECGHCDSAELFADASVRRMVDGLCAAARRPAFSK